MASPTPPPGGGASDDGRGPSKRTPRREPDKPSGKGSAAAWVKPAADGSRTYGPFWDCGTMRMPDVAPVRDGDQGLKQLADLPRAAWTQVERPSAGYNNRTLVYCMGQPHEALLDTGAVTSAISEETLIGILNRARREGYTAADPEWPVQALEEWGSVEEASGVSRGAPLRIIGQVVLQLELRAVDDQRITQPMRMRIFKGGAVRPGTA